MITKDLNLAKEILTNKNLIAIPTETVYGLAGNAFSKTAVKKIFELKKRPLFNPLIVHIKSVEYLQEIATDIPASALKLAENFWPGPLTLVLNKKEIVPNIVTANKNTVAVRIPNHPVALQLLEELEFPLAAPSANPFSTISPTTPEHVQNYFGNELEAILDGGICERGIESTIIGFEGEQPIIYRLGSLSVEEIEEKVGKVFTINKDDNAPLAPGMMSRHYAPRTEMVLTPDLKETIKNYAGKRVGILAFHKMLPTINANNQEVLTETGDLQEAARNLYAAMHRLDNQKLDVIIAERLLDIGLGKTINDKLERATKKENQLTKSNEISDEEKNEALLNIMFPKSIP